jgi:predicted GNAT family N-acyltransferase/predicted HAD superfamily Cof-like phosphohydrolase
MIQIEKFTTVQPELSILAFGIRKLVFVEEQNVDPKEEFDSFEDSSTHFLMFYVKDPVATARWRFTENGIKLERFAVLQEYRNKGLGAILLKTVIADVKDYKKPIYLHAQVKAMNFYEREGFVKTGPMFSECNILHYKMYYQPHAPRFISIIDKVKEFHDAFGIANNYTPVGKLDERDYRLRHRLMHEENEEYLQASERSDIIEIADALGDKLYILCGTILKHGLQDRITDIFMEIHNSNMYKLDENGKPIYREYGKIMKSSRYFRPNISKFFKD